MRNVLLIILLTISSHSLIFAQLSSETVKDEVNGYSFKVPANWSNQKLDDGSVLVNDDKTANLVVKSHRYKDFDSMIKSEGGIEKDGFIQLGNTTSFDGGGRHFRAYKEANGKHLIIDTIFLLSEYGGGVFILALSTDKTSAETAFKAAIELGQTLTFSPPKKSAQSSNLKSLFAGKKLSYFYRGNGYSESKKIWLCPSGAYIYNGESFSNSQIGTGSTSGSSRGTWQIKETGVSVQLILNRDDGGIGVYEISARQSSNEIGLNGDRFFVESSDECS